MLAYISGPLHAAKDLEQARTFYEFIADICERAGVAAYVPHMRTDPVRQSTISDEEVFRTDYEAMCSASVIVAAIGEPSSGVGAELGVAYRAGIPVIAVFRAEERPSRFLLGMLKSMAGAIVFSFANESECASRLTDALGDVSMLPDATAEAFGAQRSAQQIVGRSNCRDAEAFGSFD